MKDSNGKLVKVGSYVRTPRGISKVTAVLDTDNAFHASEVEVIPAREGKASKSADGDSIIWGS